MRYLIILMLFLCVPLNAFSEHIHPEKFYQNAWCSKNGGVTEYVLSDAARVDCLTNGYAVEFDFANKVYESIGQAFYYASMTGKSPAVVLISENGLNDQKYINRLNEVAKKFNLKYWVITPQK